MRWTQAAFAATLAASTAAVAVSMRADSPPSLVNQTQCNGQSYTYQSLAGYGFIPSNATDKFGDTIGGIGSSIAFDRLSWRKTYTGYSGTLYTLPDRGWNTEGTLNFQGRLHKLNIDLTPNPAASVEAPAAPNIDITYQDTVLFTGPDGKPTTGIDGNPTGSLSYPAFPDLPPGTYQGDGFGGPGPGDTRVVNDLEGLVYSPDGSYWISDEYGPYIYHFSQTGQLM